MEKLVILNHKGLYYPANFVGKVIPCNAETQEIEKYQIIHWYKNPIDPSPSIVEYKEGEIKKQK